jgi:glycosyltransferase involved in cell wall biosynthesis
VVGGGPALDELRARFPAVMFTGYKYGAELARHLAAADVFVFPSRTDTFGLVVLEAMACGVPVAAYPVGGPIDVVQQGSSGYLHEDLAMAVRGALEVDREACRRHALRSPGSAPLSSFSTISRHARAPDIRLQQLRHHDVVPLSKSR